MKFSREPLPLLNPDKPFTDGGKPIGYTALDYWRFQFSNIWAVQEEVAEFIVAKALGLELPHNKNGWTPFDILYKGKRIEIKSSASFHSWRADQVEDDRSRRYFGIAKTQGQHNEKLPNAERQNDIYVFCLNVGNSFESSDPFEMTHWFFFVVPTARINIECGDDIRISLSHLKQIATRSYIAN